MIPEQTEVRAYQTAGEYVVHIRKHLATIFIAVIDAQSGRAVDMGDDFYTEAISHYKAELAFYRSQPKDMSYWDAFRLRQEQLKIERDGKNGQH